MKVFKCILKIVAALAAVLGFIYVMATYGDKIVAWCKERIIRIPEADEAAEPAEEDVPAEEPIEEQVEEAPVEEAPVEEVVVEEVPAEAAVAEEADFEA